MHILGKIFFFTPDISRNINLHFLYISVFIQQIPAVYYFLGPVLDTRIAMGKRISVLKDFIFWEGLWISNQGHISMERWDTPVM